jgi:vacuolar-type H+-ATPase subunit B/Vma2
VHFKALSVLRQVGNMANGNITYPSTLVMMSLLQLGTSGISHPVVTHNHNAYTRQLLNSSAATDAGYDAVESTGQLAVTSEGRAQYVTPVDDYLHRPAELAALPPVLFTAL